MLKKLAILSTLVFLFISCGGDDPPRTLPSGISSVNGDYFKAVMGTTETDRPMTFVVRDVDGTVLPEQWVHFQTLIGDGNFTSDSTKTNSSGQVTAFYNFSGSLGHAELMAYVRNVDSIIVSVRANILKPGPGGQGQYILFDDTYEDIRNYNGNPEIIDVDPNAWVLYVVYEITKGVVVVIDDINRNNIQADTAEVLGVIVNNLLTTYSGKTADSLGMNSTKAEFEAVYGLTNDFGYDAGSPGDPTNPPAWRYHYPFDGITFYTDTNIVVQDREVFEIHLSELVVTR